MISGMLSGCVFSWLPVQKMCFFFIEIETVFTVIYSCSVICKFIKFDFEYLLTHIFEYLIT